ncbi:MAG: quinol:cytochrome C oxidoreductase, partial [Bacteroidetes bacterium]
MKAESYDIDERFVFSDGAKKSVFTILGIGLVFFVIGIISLAFGGSGEGAE